MIFRNVKKKYNLKAIERCINVTTAQNCINLTTGQRRTKEDNVHIFLERVSLTICYKKLLESSPFGRNGIY